MVDFKKFRDYYVNDFKSLFKFSKIEKSCHIADFHLKTFNLEETGNLSEGKERQWNCNADIFVNPVDFISIKLQVNKENNWINWFASTGKLIHKDSNFSVLFTWKANRTLNGIKLRCVIIYNGQKKNITADHIIEVKCK